MYVQLKVGSGSTATPRRFLWNMVSVLVTGLNTASLPTRSLARKEAHLCDDLERVVSLATLAA